MEKILGLDDILDEDLLDDYYHLSYPDAAMEHKSEERTTTGIAYMSDGSSKSDSKSWRVIPESGTYL